jgi:hypothetical protein
VTGGLPVIFKFKIIQESVTCALRVTLTCPPYEILALILGPPEALLAAQEIIGPAFTFPGWYWAGIRLSQNNAPQFRDAIYVIVWDLLFLLVISKFSGFHVRIADGLLIPSLVSLRM